MGQYSGTVMVLAATSWCCWAVSLGGLAAVQASCGDSDLMNYLWDNPGLACYRRLQYEWFIIFFELFVTVGLIGSILAKAYIGTRQAWGLFAAMVTLLYIQLSNKWYTISLANGLDGTLYTRVATLTAGLIMVSAINCIMVFILGLPEPEERKDIGNQA